MTVSEKEALMQKISAEYISRFLTLDIKNDLSHLDVITLTGIYCEATDTLEKDMFFTIEDKDVANKKIQEKINQILKLIITKIRSDDLYVIYNKVTRLPEIGEKNTIFVFSNKEIAMDCVNYINKEMYKQCVLCTFTEEEEKIKLFTKVFYTLGLDKIVLDNGWKNLILKRDDLFTIETPIQSNPRLFNVMTKFIQEISWEVTYEGKDEKIESLDKKLYEELKTATFYVPIKVINGEVACLALRTEDGEEFAPIFTDIFEMEGFVDDDMEEQKISCLTIDDLDINSKYILNPGSLEFPILKESLQKLKKH